MHRNWLVEVNLLLSVTIYVFVYELLGIRFDFLQYEPLNRKED